MKIKKRIGLLFLVLILLGTVTVYGTITFKNSNSTSNSTNVTVSNNTKNATNASNTTNTTNITNTTNSTTKNSTKNSSNNVVQNNTISKNEVSENETIPALEEKLKEEEGNTTSSDSSKKSEVSEVLDDIYLIDTGTLLGEAIELNYEDTYIDGNVYIISTSKVTFSQCEIIGNVFVISNEFEMTDTVVNGSVYVGSGDTTFVECDLYSLYALADNLTIDEDTVISTDVRAGGTIITIAGTVGRNVYIAYDTVNIEDSADIAGKCELTAKEYDVPKSLENSDNFSITIVEETENTIVVSLQSVLGSWGSRVVIVLIIALIILGGSPKFTAVNCTLRIRDFFKAFFTGILEIIVIFAILLYLLLLGLGNEYLVAVMFIMIGLLCLGKVIFTLSFAIRLVSNKNKNPRVKAFIYTIIVAIILEAINLFALFGNVGVIAVLIINLILSVSGFGTFVRIVLTARKKKNPEPDKKINQPTPTPKAPVSPVAIKEEPKPVEPKVEPMVNQPEEDDEEVETESKMIEIPVKRPQPKTSDNENKVEDSPKSVNEDKIENKDIDKDSKREIEETVSEASKDDKEDEKKDLNQEENSKEKIESENVVEETKKDEKTDDFVISDKNKKHKKLFGKEK